MDFFLDSLTTTAGTNKQTEKKQPEQSEFSVTQRLQGSNDTR